MLQDSSRSKSSPILPKPKLVDSRKIKNHIIRFVKRSRIGTGICDLLMQCPAVHDLSSRLDSGGLYQNAADLFHSNSDEIVLIEQLLWDAKSLMSYRSVRYAMLSQRGRSLRKTAQPMRFQYFDPTIPIRPEAYRYFADCGACNGDTIQSFCANLGAAAINELYAFEPDAYNESQNRSFACFVKRRTLKM